MALTPHEKKLLEIVIGVAENDLNQVRAGVVAALRDENDKGYRTHLWCVLPPAARRRIRAGIRPKLELTP